MEPVNQLSTTPLFTRLRHLVPIASAMKVPEYLRHWSKFTKLLCFGKMYEVRLFVPNLIRPQNPNPMYHDAALIKEAKLCLPNLTNPIAVF